MPFTRMIDACFENLGVEATYTPQGGSPVTVKVIAKRPDEVVGFGETRIQAETTVFDVRISEVAPPQAGDMIAFDGATYLIQGEPRAENRQEDTGLPTGRYNHPRSPKAARSTPGGAYHPPDR